MATGLAFVCRGSVVVVVVVRVVIGGPAIKTTPTMAMLAMTRTQPTAHSTAHPTTMTSTSTTMTHATTERHYFFLSRLRLRRYILDFILTSSGVRAALTGAGCDTVCGFIGTVRQLHPCIWFGVAARWRKGLCAARMSRSSTHLLLHSHRHGVGRGRERH